MTHTRDAPGLSEPVQIFGEVEAEALGLAFGSMVFTVKAGSSTEPHSHASEEIWVVRSGYGVANLTGQDTGLQPGSRLIVPPDTVHTLANHSDDDMTVIAFWWRKSGDAE
jgi:quercetin dioxygenase-like cupin family protein